MKHVRFFYDIVCPYAYLASTQIARICERAQVEVEWVPMLLGGIFRHIGAPQIPAAQMSTAKARMNTLDLERWAARWGVPFHFSPHHPQRTVEAMRLLCVTPIDLRPAVSARLFEAYWSEGARLDVELLTNLAQEFQLIDSLGEAPWRTAQAREALFTYTAQAADLGVFGAPSFEIDGRIFWGQDRLHLVLEELGASRNIWRGGEAPQGTEVVLYHDFSSPFSYLASTQASTLIQERGAKLIWRPILLGALFQSIGAPNVPLFEMNPPKRAYMGQDLKDWARWWEVPFSFPTSFPLRTPTPLRVSLLDEETIPVIYRAAWAEGRDIGAPQELAQILTEAGFHGEELIKKTQDPKVKAVLRENTQEAKDRQVFGVPSFELRRPEEPPQLFWGQDRLELLCEALVAP